MEYEIVQTTKAQAYHGNFCFSLIQIFCQIL